MAGLIVWCVENAGRTLMRIMGPALICLATGLTLSIYYYGCTRVLRPLFATNWFIFFSALASVIVFNILFNYVMCVLTDAGSHTSTAYERLVEAAREEGKLDFGSEATVGPYDWQRCKSRAPQRRRAHTLTACPKSCT